MRRPSQLWAVTVAGALMSAGAAAVAASPHQTAPGFTHLVDSYLDRFGHYHPSIAAGNGLHDHDGQLEDFSAPSIAQEIHWLHTTRHSLDALDDRALNADEQVDRRILQGIVDGWLLDLETVRTWTRNPMVYVAAISDGLHDLATMESALPQVRIQHVITKLHGVASLLTSARANIKAPPRVFVERAIAMLGGVTDLLSHDLPLAFAAVHNESLVARLKTEVAAANAQLAAYRKDLETRVLPAATGNFATGTANVEARYRAEELIDLPASVLLRIGERELALEQAEFAQTAARIDATQPALQVWASVQDNHPARGQVVPAARAVVEELFAFISAHQLINLPPDQHVIVAPAPAYDLGLASMHSSPPLEPHPVQSHYYITDASADWPIERQNAWLRTFNYATLADISAHEVAPGHYVHSLFMRHTPGKIRRIWVGLNPAGREAARGTYDPTYGGYFLGKLAAFKLRKDYQAALGPRFNLREFHERVMTNGIAPWWAHRQLLLPGDHGAVVE